MTLFVIIASLVLDRIADADKSLRSLEFVDEMVNRGLERTAQNDWMGLPVVLLTILLPALLVQFFAGMVEDQLFGLLTLLWSIFVLFMCIGPRPLEFEVDEFLQAAGSEPDEIADDRAFRLTGEENFADAKARNTAVIRAIFAHLNTHIVAVVFWFVVLGPMGAVLYRISLQLTDKSENRLQIPADLHERLITIVGLLTWLPARLVLLAYALAGKFDGTLDNLPGFESSGANTSLFDDNNATLSDAGVNALGVQASGDVSLEDVRAARQLAIRAMTMCLALVALLTISGWFA